MPLTQSKRPHRNHYLFSNYYLDELLPSLPQWQKEDNLRGVFIKIKNRYEKQKGSLSKLNETQLESAFIKPTLKDLSHIFEVQPSLPTKEGWRQPDYAFFADEKDKNLARQYLRELKFFKNTIAIGDAKSWETSLDKKGKGPEGDYNPSLQMDRYLWRTEVKWGILTNGRFWRLYYRETSARLDIFYEVDLVSLLENKDYNAFKYFYFFFRREAFPEFLDSIYQNSIDYAEAVGKDLKKNVYDALEVLMKGFFETPGNNLSIQEDLKKTHDNSLVFLYRVLFTLYAESRRLLPIENKTYLDSYSLHTIKNEIAQQVESPIEKEKLLPGKTDYWYRLEELFDLINRGSEALKISRETFYVPAYNGGLFNPEEHTFLKDFKVGDSFLAQAIDLLARSPSKKGEGRAFVDYSSLEIRHLGSIYEGLLEFRPKIAQEDMITIKEKGRERWVFLKEGEGKKELEKCSKGDFYLGTDKGERKATGSYYTPSYIVEYIVRNTLGPIVKDKREKAEKKIKKLKTQLKKTRGHNRKLYEKEIQKQEMNLIKEILSLKILDPAMGSGHFLVEATDYLARALVGILGGTSKRLQEEEIRWARREVVEKCIYGVDLNPLAIELAKLSLWLSTVAKNKPLSFLDHHLRCGNSLIGARIKDLNYLPAKVRKKEDKEPSPQLTLFETYAKQDLPRYAQDLNLISKMPSETVEDIKKKEDILKSVDTKRDIYRKIADFWVSTYFGLKLEEKKTEFYEIEGKTIASQMSLFGEAEAAQISLLDENKSKPISVTNAIFRHMVDALRNPKEQELVKSLQPLLKQTREIAEEKHFFHWEIEFPDVFFTNNPGFDAVVGNPPWVSFSGRQKAILDNTDLRFYRTSYKVFSKWPSLHTIFGELAFSVTNENGYHSFIVPDQVGYLNNYQEFRKLFTDGYLVSVCYTGEEVFKDVVSPTLIYVSSKKRNEQVTIIDKTNIPHEISTEELLQDSSFKWTITPDRKIWNKIINLSFCLKKEFGDPGVHTGNCAAKLILSQQVKNSAPILEGNNIERYNFPESRSFLNLEYIPLTGEYFTIRDINIYRNTKLVIRQTASHLIATRHIGTYFRNNLLAYYGHDKLSDLYILALLNSKLFRQFYKSKYIESAQKAFPQVKVLYLRELPIRQISFNTSRIERERIIDRFIKMYKELLKI